MNQFNEKLKEWTDFDVAMHLLAVNMGLLDENERFIENKGIYYTDNKYSRILGGTLRKLIEVGYLEFNEDEIQVRKNKSFELSIRDEI